MGGGGGEGGGGGGGGGLHCCCTRQQSLVSRQRRTELGPAATRLCPAASNNFQSPWHAEVSCLAAAVAVAVAARTGPGPNSKHWFATSFLGGSCRKAMLGVWSRTRLTDKATVSPLG